jgi:hypothetical protein
MVKKTNNRLVSILLVVAFISLLVFLAMVYALYNSQQSFFGNEINVYMTCDDALAMYTNGAGLGECFVNVENNAETVAYVSYINEKYNKNTNGNNVLCNIKKTTSTAKVFTCDVAIKKDLTTVQVCSSDSMCPSERCVNHMCKEGVPTKSCTVGESQCLSNTKYLQCLNNSKWSGNLYCNSNEECSFDSGKCELLSGACTKGEYNCEGYERFYCRDGLTWIDMGKSSECGFENNSFCPDNMLMCDDGTCKEDCEADINSTEEQNDVICQDGLTQCSNGTCAEDCSVVTNETLKNVALGGSVISGLALIGLAFKLYSATKTIVPQL